MNSLPRSRRWFVRTSAGLLVTGLFARFTSAQDSSPPPPGVPKAPTKPPSLPLDKVQATVGAAHGNLDKLLSLVEETPLLVNACWDQGGGDFETPLQAAAHMGRHDIAEFLLSKNARPDLYAAAMLGQLEPIKAALTQNPRVHEVPGPHGFTLLYCAKQGSDPAKAVYDYLIAQGVPAVMQRPLPYVWPTGVGPAAI